MKRRARTTVQNVNPPLLAPAVGFSHATRAEDFVFVGGQIGVEASGKVASLGDMTAQFSAAINNVRTALGAVSCRPADVVKLTYFVTDVGAYRAALKPIGVAYREVFGRHFPATSLVGVTALFIRDAMVEIDCVAIFP